MFGKSSNDYNLSYYSGSDDVRYVDYLNDEKQVIKREEYNKEGKPVIVSHFDTKTNQIFLQEFINNENVVYLEKHFMWMTKVKQSNSHILLGTQKKTL